MARKADLPRIIFLDMEGTLLRKEHRLDDGRVAPSAWTLLAERIGPDCLKAENETKERWRSQGYPSYLEWMRETVEIHRRFALGERLFSEVMRSVEFTPGVDEALRQIHGWGAVSVLITGGFKALADRVQRRLRIMHAFAGCEYFFDPESHLIQHVNLLPADEVGKVDFMRLMCREYCVSPRDCAFVGDGMNDRHLAEQVGFSLAFNAQPELVAVASASISQGHGQEDFLAVAEVIEKDFKMRKPSDNDDTNIPEPGKS